MSVCLLVCLYVCWSVCLYVCLPIRGPLTLRYTLLMGIFESIKQIYINFTLLLQGYKHMMSNQNPNPNPSQSGLRNHLVGRRIYLATYSQADECRFPTRKSFAEYLVEKFDAGSTKVKVVQWVCCKEAHKEGGFHYHCAFKMSGQKKWFGPWKTMHNDGVVVSFSEKHDYYVSAYTYVIKQDEHFILSNGHPNLDGIGSPRTKACMASNKRRSSARNELKFLDDSQDASQDEGSPKKKKTEKRKWNRKIEAIDVADFIIKQNISTKTQLYAEANKRKEEGECDLAIYIFKRSEKYLSELISKAWSMHNAQRQLSDNAKTRLDRLEEAANGECVTAECTWLDSALELLQLNKINRVVFQQALASAMTRGRRKFNNIMLVGRSNCGKTFLLKPLKAIFEEKLFENPPRDKYGWQGVQSVQVICLQDFRYSKEVIGWSDLLLLLEGETVKLPAPKNHFAEDIVISSSNDIPIFATGPGKIAYSLFSPDHEVETDMMASRWRIFKLTHIIEKEKQKEIPPCKRCFAKFVLGV